MRLITDIDSLHLDNTVVILGNFDGIHKGHLTLLNKAKEVAKEKGLKTVFFTFYPHPTHVLAPVEVKLINTDIEKQHIAEEEGMDFYLQFPFTKESADMEAVDFIHKILYQHLGAKAVVVGEDYSFGKDRVGDVAMLREYANTYDYDLFALNKLEHKGRIVSSTWIRKAIEDADFELVKELTGRDYSVVGEVVHGARLGRTIGFPTANVKPTIHKQLPKNGVYITTVTVGGENYYGLTNVGTKPTIDVNFTEVLVETFIYDFTDMIYGEMINVCFHKHLRSEDAFDSIDDLIVQMKKDEKELVKYFDILEQEKSS